MGIKQLMNIINEKASKAVKKMTLSDYSGKVIACDASMAMYQFLIATQNASHHGLLTDESGNLTSHLIGIFYRTIMFLDNGIKPIWVFDGSAPDLKITELSRRKQNRFQAKEKILLEHQNSQTFKLVKGEKNEDSEKNFEENVGSSDKKIMVGEKSKKYSPEKKWKRWKKTKKTKISDKADDLENIESIDNHIIENADNLFDTSIIDNPGDLVNPDNPNNPDNTNNPGNFDTPDNPANPDNPINTDNPGNPINPENPKVQALSTEEKKPILKKKKLTKFQLQAIQKKNYGSELEEIEISLRTRISALLGFPISELNTPDYLCYGESDEEDLSLTKELEQIVSSLELKGCQNIEEVHKNMKKVTHITFEMIEDVKEMLIYMGIPVIEAPSEAEAQCAELVRSGKAYAVASEDMDALAFGAGILLRGFNNKKEPIIEINLSEVLNSLKFSHSQFVDLCILLGCDYSKTITGVGAAKAYKLIKQCYNIEKIIEFLGKQEKFKTRVPADFAYKEARELFSKPKIVNTQLIDIVWKPPNEDKVKEFLVCCKGFSLHRIENSLKRLKNQHIGNQPKIESFFEMPQKRPLKNSEDQITKKNKSLI